MIIPMILLLTSCGPSLKDSEQKVDGMLPDSGVVLTAEQIKNGDITFGKIEKRQLSFDIRAKGKLVLLPQNFATVSSMSAGMVETIPVKTGQNVVAGQTLATIASQEIIQIQQDFIATDGRSRLLEKEYLRQKSLSQDKITSDKKFQEAETAFREAQLARESLRLKVQLMNINPDGLLKGEIRHSANVVSPISGTIEEIGVNIGRFIEPNTVLFHVINKSQLNLELMVFEKDIPFIKQGQRVSFELANLNGTKYDAQIASIGRSVEEDARAVKVLAAFNNTSPFILPGMFAVAEIHTDEQDLDALPEEAILTGVNNETYCFYTLSPASSSSLNFQKLMLKTGFREDGYVQVAPVTLLPSGGRIVIKGSYFIKAEQLKQQE